MNILDVVKSSRTLLKARPYVERNKLFTRHGIVDGWKFPRRIGDCQILATSVFGGMDVSVLQIVRDKIATPIFIENLIFAENPSLAQVYEKEMGDAEAISYVEKHTPEKGMSYYKIICVSKTRCGARFSICKELMHIYTQQVQKVGVAEKMLKKAMRWRKVIVEASKELTPETACFYHAVEVLLSWDFRDKQVAVVKKKYGQVHSCDKHVAISFMIPLSIIKHVFDCTDDEKDYYAFSYQLNSRCYLIM